METETYKGIIVKESLDNPSVLDALDVVEIPDENENGDSWHTYRVNVTADDIEKISLALKPRSWYAHFWNDRELIVTYRDRTFAFERNNTKKRQEAIEYGLTVGIPKEQLDFLIDESY